jgi:hypothetical protein
MIENERISTIEKLTKTMDVHTINPKYYKEIVLRAQREYSGQQLRAVYTDRSKG